jgi:ubiquinone/menaquinone biosynthesis C-methylase UbiE
MVYYQPDRKSDDPGTGSRCRGLGMLARQVLITAATAATLGAALVPASVSGQAPGAQTQSPPRKPPASGKKHVDPEINKPFQKAKVKDFVKRFESEDREVYARRGEIVKALGLKPGMAVADIGAGTGLFTRLFAEQVGRDGKVYAVDISKDFLDYIARGAKARGQSQVVTIQGSQDSTGLPAGSIDMAFLCDVYHHLEHHERVLASIREALKPGGTLVLIEFDRVEGKSSDFVLKHIRASRSEFIQEIEAAGFEQVAGAPLVKLKENFMARFRRVDGPRVTTSSRRREPPPASR